MAAPQDFKEFFGNQPVYKKIVVEFLRQEPEYVRLLELRYNGWVTNKEKGDAHFDAQRKRSDNASLRTRKYFYKMMIEIAYEMHYATGVFNIEKHDPSDVKVLDVCMAPGGFMTAISKLLPEAERFGLTLPTDLGGHRMIFDSSKLKGFLELDVALLVTEYATRSIPENHPEKSMFSNKRPFDSEKFDIVVCDGNALRTHERSEWREYNEKNRLNISQIILSMQRINNYGTIIILLHKVDSWDTINIIYKFSKFSSIRFFKPEKKHCTRSSFYLIASKINMESNEAKKALHDWRKSWWQINFGGQDGTGRGLQHEVGYVQDVLTKFGKEFIKMAKPIWKIQADGLSRTDFAGVRKCKKVYVNFSD